MHPLMILVAGPYRSGTNDDPVLIARNVAAMTEASLQLFRAGHLPAMGEWFALPLIEHAGSTRFGDAAFDEIFHPVARRLVARCDACLRIGGASAGADEMVALAQQHGKAVYRAIEDVPAAPAQPTPRFTDADLSAAAFADVNLRGASFLDVALSGATFQNVDLADVGISDARLDGMRINGVLVSDLFRAYNQLNPS